MTSAGRAGAAASVGSVQLVSQSPWVGDGGDFLLRLHATAPSPQDVEVAVTIYPALATRSDFNASVDGRVRGSAVSVSATPLTDLAPDANGVITVRLPIQSAAQPRDPFRIRLRGTGVFPVVVELRGIGGGARIDRFVTHMINLPEPITGPRLSVGFVLPAAAPLALQPDGTRKTKSNDVAALDALSAALDSHADIPVTMLPRPETLQALSLSPRSTDRDAYVALSRTLAARLTLAGPYVRLSEAGYANAGLESEDQAQRRHGVEVDTALLGRAPSSDTAVVEDGVDDATANRLRDAGAVRAVVRESALAPVNLRTTLAQPFLLRGRNGRDITAAAADDGLGSHFNSKAPPVLAAHQLLADLAVLYFDSPGLARGVVALPPPSWHPDAGFLSELLDGVRANPIVAPVDIDELFRSVRPAGTGRSALVRDPATTGNVPAPLAVADLRKARRDLAGLDGLAIGARPPVLTELDERILAAQSADLRPRQRTQYLAAASNAIQHELRSIRVPTDQSITLTARRGEIPITVQRDVPYPVRVFVQLSSDKLQFPTGASATLDLVRRNTTERFTVQARTSGTFPLRVTLRSPDRRVVLSTGRFTIRSRAASGVGVILSVSALCFLVIWWGRHLVHARRGRRASGVPATVGA